MEDVERARERLENVRSVKPILNGLRTISLGSWQAALKRRSAVRNYGERIEAMLPHLVPHLGTTRGVVDRLREQVWPFVPLSGRGSQRREAGRRPIQTKTLVIGSERGLCGRFNLAVADEAERYLRRLSTADVHVDLDALGSRVHRILSRRGHEVTPAGTLSVTTLPSLSMAFALTQQWLTAYERHELDRVHLIYNDYRGTGAFDPTLMQLIPPLLPTDERRLSTGAASSEQAWPPPIIDTDPHSLYAIVVEQWTAVQLYDTLLNSSAAEHATRFQLMEAATQNADQLIEDLMLAIQTARRQEITQEMAELATGAGLLDKK